MSEEAFRGSSGGRSDGNTWLGLPVEETTGDLEDLAKRLPRFERREFAVTPRPQRSATPNKNYDVIERLPLNDSESEIPVGTVSKTYRLVQHHEVFDLATDALRGADIDLTKVDASLALTEYGERMALSLSLPDLEEYRLRVAEGDSMGLSLDCYNSVEGSTRFVALLGWFRFVCSNGLIVGASLSDLRRLHDQQLDVTDVGWVLREALGSAKREKHMYESWIRTKVQRVNGFE